MWWSRITQISFICVLLSMLAACGFRLQGEDRFGDTLANVYIETADRYTVFYRELVVALEQGGAQTMVSPLDASAVIRIERDETGQDVLTVSSRNVPTEYDVYYSVSYSVWVDGEAVLPSRTITVRQDYTYDATLVLGKQREEEAIRRSIATSLIRQVSQQLARL